VGEVVSPFAARRRLSDDTSVRLVWNLNWAVRPGMPVSCHSRAALLSVCSRVPDALLPKSRLSAQSEFAGVRRFGRLSISVSPTDCAPVAAIKCHASEAVMPLEAGAPAATPLSARRGLAGPFSRS
jgi:hypothetical protein